MLRRRRGAPRRSTTWWRWARRRCSEPPRTAATSTRAATCRRAATHASRRSTLAMLSLVRRSLADDPTTCLEASHDVGRRRRAARKIIAARVRRDRRRARTPPARRRTPSWRLSRKRRRTRRRPPRSSSPSASRGVCVHAGMGAERAGAGTAACAATGAAPAPGGGAVRSPPRRARLRGRSWLGKPRRAPLRRRARRCAADARSPSTPRASRSVVSVRVAPRLVDRGAAKRRKGGFRSCTRRDRPPARRARASRHHDARAPTRTSDFSAPSSANPQGTRPRRLGHRASTRRRSEGDPGAESPARTNFAVPKRSHRPERRARALAVTQRENPRAAGGVAPASRRRPRARRRAAMVQPAPRRAGGPKPRRGRAPRATAPRGLRPRRRWTVAVAPTAASRWSSRALGDAGVAATCRCLLEDPSVGDGAIDADGREPVPPAPARHARGDICRIFASRPRSPRRRRCGGRRRRPPRASRRPAKRRRTTFSSGADGRPPPVPRRPHAPPATGARPAARRRPSATTAAERAGEWRRRDGYRGFVAAGCRRRRAARPDGRRGAALDSARHRLEADDPCRHARAAELSACDSRAARRARRAHTIATLGDARAVAVARLSAMFVLETFGGRGRCARGRRASHAGAQCACGRGGAARRSSRRWPRSRVRAPRAQRGRHAAADAGRRDRRVCDGVCVCVRRRPPSAPVRCATQRLRGRAAVLPPARRAPAIAHAAAFARATVRLHLAPPRRAGRAEEDGAPASTPRALARRRALMRQTSARGPRRRRRRRRPVGAARTAAAPAPMKLRSLRRATCTCCASRRSTSCTRASAFRRTASTCISQPRPPHAAHPAP